MPLIKTVIDNKCSVAQTHQITRICPCLCPLFYWRTNILFLLGEVKSERKRKFLFIGQLLGARSRGKIILPGTLCHGAPKTSHFANILEPRDLVPRSLLLQPQEPSFWSLNHLAPSHRRHFEPTVIPTWNIISLNIFV